MTKKILLFIIIFPQLMLFSNSLENSDEFLSKLDKNAIAALNKDEQVFRYDKDGHGIQFMPDKLILKDITQRHKELNPDVMVEALYKIPLPDGMDKGSILNKIMEISHRVSTISGVKYYSERKSRYSILFDNVYAVNSLDEKKKIGDPKPNYESNTSFIPLHMKENAMGRGYYSMKIESCEDYVSIDFINETAQNFILRVVNDREMFIALRIFPFSDCILIYGYCGVILQNEDFIKLIMDPYSSFYRRMTAMETWLYNNLYNTNKLPLVLEPFE